MVPSSGRVSGPTPAPRRRRLETDVVAVAKRYLEDDGYRVWVDPDGQNYFDIVARRGREVGLVEAKVAGARDVLTQALRRRAWGDWCAVVLGSERSARALAQRTTGTRAAPVGVWFASADAVTVVRAARPWTVESETDPFAELRARFARILDALESGEIPESASWEGVVREVRRASGGRGFREWRLDESPV
jgi:hypothetical protein